MDSTKTIIKSIFVILVNQIGYELTNENILQKPNHRVLVMWGCFI